MKAARGVYDFLGADNAVAAIYLNYRLYDTLFEALLLLIAIVGIIHFFRIGIRNDKLVTQRRSLAGAGRAVSGGQEIVSRITGFLYPFVILFGFYVIVNGHDTPGGGFQGGAILATLFIGRFIVKPVNDINAQLLHDVEQALFVFIMLVPIVFLFYQLNDRFPGLNEAFLILMNVMDVGAILFLITVNYVPGALPPVAPLDGAIIADPIPQALMITAIVIGIAVSAVSLAVFITLFRRYGSADWETVLKRVRER